MNLNELRIGNYVCTSYMKKSVFKVNAIHSDRLYFDSIVENFKSDTIPIYVEPIPITEEWLLKAGFKHIGDTSHFKCYEFKNSACRFIIDYGYERFFFQFHKHETLSSIRLEYVHELQNLFFSLCGEELVFSSTEP